MFQKRNVVMLSLATAGLALGTACSSSGTHGSHSPPASSGSSVAGGGSSVSTVDVRTAHGSRFLTDGAGRSLYLWIPDTKTKSMCSGACAAAWPPLTVKGTPTAGAGATAADLGTISRADGTKQVSYAGHPLYYFAGDTRAAQTNGEGSNGFGAPWYLIAPSGQQVTSLSSSSASSTGGGGY